MLGPHLGAPPRARLPENKEAASQPLAGKLVRSEEQACVTLGWGLSNGFAASYAHSFPAMTDSRG